MRKAAIPRPEIQVLKRLREAREKLGLSQPEFSKEMGISRAQLANYEYFKSPLPLGLGLRICHHFIIGERWLATGMGPLRQLFDLRTLPSRNLTHADDPTINSGRHTFAAGYRRFFAQYAEKTAVEMERTGQLFKVNLGAVFDLNRAFVKNYLHALIEQWMHKLGEEDKLELLCGFLSSDANDYVTKLATQKVEYSDDGLKKYLVDADGRRMEIDPFKNEREHLLDDNIEELKAVLNESPEFYEFSHANDEKTETKIADYLTKNMEALRAKFVDDPAAIKNFENFLRYRRGEPVFPPPELKWQDRYKDHALETKQDMADYIKKHLPKIQADLAGNPEAIKEIVAFLGQARSADFETSLEGFSPLQAKKLAFYLASIGLGELDPAIMSDGPYAPDVKLLVAANSVSQGSQHAVPPLEPPREPLPPPKKLIIPSANKKGS